MLRNRHVAVWISAIVFFLLGAFWYTALQAPWLAGIGKTLDELTREQGGSPLPYAVAFASLLVVCYTLAWLLARTNARSIGAGVRLGAVVAVGFVAAMLALNYGFEFRSPRLWLINAGYSLVGLCTAGGILGRHLRRTN
jgi:hypothetical protein